MKKFPNPSIYYFLVITVMLVGCKKQAIDTSAGDMNVSITDNVKTSNDLANRELVLYWNEKAVELLTIHTNPGSDARRMAIIQIGIHDALNSINEKYERYAFTAPVNPQASSQAAVCSAARKLLRWAMEDLLAFFTKFASEGGPQIPFDISSRLALIDKWYQEKMNEIPNNPRKTAGQTIGEQSANAIIAKRENDGHSNIHILSDQPLDGTVPGLFKADYYAIGPKNKIMADYGTLVMPFVLNNASQFTQPIQPTSLNLDDIQEVSIKGNTNYVTNHLNAEEKLLVDTWSNIQQHIVWNNFTVQIIKRQLPKFDAWNVARVLALVHTAMADGTISLFKDAYFYYRWRPVTAIRNILDPSWSAYLAAPRIPEYPSTFGILGGATGAILIKEFSDDIDIMYGAISYTSITQAVTDNTETKIYCGWNFRDTFKPSMNQGKLIGEFVYHHRFKEAKKR